MRLTLNRGALVAAVATSLIYSGSARAEGNKGFQLERYEPTAAGEQDFWVDHPWFSATRSFAAGLTFDYAHNPLVYARDAKGHLDTAHPVIGSEFVGHLDLAASFGDYVTVSGSLPLVLGMDGSPLNGIEPISGVALGDPRVGVMFRAGGHSDLDPFSVSVGVNVWIPIGVQDKLAGDSSFRLMPKVALGGVNGNVRWSLTGAVLFRNAATVDDQPAGNGNSTGLEAQVGAALGYISDDHRLAIGPEVLFGFGGEQDTFGEDSHTGLEAILGAHYLIGGVVQVGAGVGIGTFDVPGNPDWRGLVRIAYAPAQPPPPPDQDKDGVPDDQDLCPTDPQGLHPDPAKRGCPAKDSDADGLFDFEDACPAEAAGAHPDPAADRKGCPAKDSDGDGLYDHEDQCPAEAAGANPDPARPGCPIKDSDGDGVLDTEDKCPTVPAGAHPNPEMKGCPDGDADHDGVLDHQDQCPNQAPGLHPDPASPGCPAPDRDDDGVPDAVDACPDKPGAPSPDPKKNGCPGLVEMKHGVIEIKTPVFFATNKDVILPQSNKVLQAVADALTATPEIKKIEIAGYTDNVGKTDFNHDLSHRRAASVLTWLEKVGKIAPERLESAGYGETHPVADNKDEKGRSLNRRVEFHIIDPKPEPAPAGTQVVTPPPVESPATREATKSDPAVKPPAPKPTPPKSAPKATPKKTK